MSNVPNMDRMFNACKKLTSLKLDHWKIPSTGFKFGYNSNISNCTGLTSLDLSTWDTSNVTDMSDMLSYIFTSSAISHSLNVSNWDTSNVTDMSDMFRSNEGLTSIIGLNTWDTSNVTDMSYMFGWCYKLKSVDLSNCNISNVTNMHDMFWACKSLTEIRMGGNPSSLTGVTSMIGYGAYGGTFYYNPAYDYSLIITEMQNNSWKCIPMYENIECVDLKIISADDACRNQVKTNVYYEATFTGKSIFDGSIVTFVDKNVGISDKFTTNPSETEEREIDITFTYKGITASTTITQGICTYQNYTIDLNYEWRLSTISNPDPSVYDGVYESFSNIEEDDSAAIMYIDIVGHETFKLYVRSYAESNYDYVVVSQLDQTINKDTNYSDSTLVKAHTRGKQNSGTAISNYTLVEFTGIDGEEHRISVMYRKDGSSASGNDQGYLLIPKN